MEIVTISLISNAVLAILLCLSLFFNIKFGKHILVVQDGIEESLDVLDQRYNSISEILDTPIFFDSTEIRQVINDINLSRDAILYVANILGDMEDAVEEKTEKTFEGG